MLTGLGGAPDRMHHVEREAALLNQPPSPKETYVSVPPEGNRCLGEHKDKLSHTDIHKASQGNEQNDRDQGGGTHRQPTTHFSCVPCNIIFQVALGGLDINHT